MQLYRFSPIKSSEECLQSLEYIDEQLKELVLLITSERLPINTLKIFSHYDEEYTFLKSWVDSIGQNDGTASASYYVKTPRPIQVNDDQITLVGIRKPDPYRSQVGCGDFIVDDYEAFKAKHIDSSPFVREVSHPTFEMLELFHPDFDVLGYVVKG